MWTKLLQWSSTYSIHLQIHQLMDNFSLEGIIYIDILLYVVVGREYNMQIEKSLGERYLI